MILTDEQFDVAVGIIDSLKSGQSCCLIGRAGVGKTTTLRYIVNNLKKVTCLAPTHQACNVLKESINRPVGTVASALGKRKEIDYDTGEINFNPADFVNDSYGVIIIDESSMLSRKDKETFIKNYPLSTFLFVGDKGQLPPISDENYSIFDQFPSYELVTNMRCGKGNDMYNLIERVYEGDLSLSTGSNVYKVTLDELDEEIPIITFYNEKRIYYNNLIFNKKGGQVNTDIKFIANENINYSKFSTKYDIKNGQTFYPEKVQTFKYLSTDKEFESIVYQLNYRNGKSVVKFNYLSHNDRVRLENYLTKFKGSNWKKYFEFKRLFPDIDLGYALTSHKVQGSTYNVVHVDVNDILKVPSKKLKQASLYVALSRSKQGVGLISYKQS